MYYSVVKELLKCDADLVKDQDKSLNTALYFACRYGHYKVAVVLLEANADPNVKLVYWKMTQLLYIVSFVKRNQFSCTPLDCASVNGYENIVQLLINHDAEVDCKDKKDVRCPPKKNFSYFYSITYLILLVHSSYESL